jgi:WD40 repeat protein
LTEAIVAKKEFHTEIIEICLDLREIYICCAFSQDEKISILSFNSLEIVHKLEGHQQKIISISFDASFEKLMSLSKDRTVRLWDLESIMQRELPLQ